MEKKLLYVNVLLYNVCVCEITQTVTVVTAQSPDTGISFIYTVT